MPFQTSVNTVQAPAVAGDFATENPRHSVPTNGGFFAGPNGLTVGLYCWADTSTGIILANTGTGLPTGFVHRNENASITAYLAEFGMTILPNSGVGDVFCGGDFWAKNAGSTAVVIGMKAFANLTNGTVTFAAPGTTVAGSIETKWWSWSLGAAGELIIISNVAPG